MNRYEPINTDVFHDLLVARGLMGDCMSLANRIEARRDKVRTCHKPSSL